MDKHTVAKIDTHMTDIAAAGIEAEYITGLKLVHMDTVIGLGRSSTVQTVAKLLIYIPDQPGAVEALFWAFSAVEIIVAHKLTGKIGYILA